MGLQGGSEAWARLTSQSWALASTSVFTTEHPTPCGPSSRQGQTPGLGVMVHTDHEPGGQARELNRHQDPRYVGVPLYIGDHTPRLELLPGIRGVSNAAGAPVGGQARGNAPVTRAQRKGSPQGQPPRPAEAAEQARRLPGAVGSFCRPQKRAAHLAWLRG